ncbi:MAG: SpaH/EbpB family LPXTG-anchored major pilin [Eubacteriales bacterium]|nr:SpaH/EbpB family LPXTG-anchored major pilin [Eubacteriales bacterium]
MKTMKKVLALLVAFVMMLTMNITVFADGTTEHTITITNADPAKQHSYEAYQVFSGSLEGDELTMISWGSGVKGDELLAALKTDPTIGTDFSSAATPADVAKVLTAYKDNSASLDAFASVVGAKLSTTKAASSETKSPYTIKVTGDGYYFVKDTTETLAEGESYSKFMLKVMKDESIEAKDDHLTPTKKIVEGEERLDENSAAIGDTITYEISIPMPKMDGYKSYFFQMKDTLDKGLTFQKVTSIQVAGEEIYQKDQLSTDDYTIAAPEGKGGNLNITYKHFIDYKGKTGNVVVTYEAILNEDAELEKSNDNTVKYKYSNNPDKTGKGEPGENDYPTGETPEDTVKTWVTQLDVLKTGDNNTIKALEGAEFELSGDALNIVLLTGTKFEAKGYTAKTGETILDGEYFKLNDGTYTKTAPTDATKEKYASETDKYVKVSFENYKTETGEAKKVTAVTGEDGKIHFTGLKPGTYTLKETVAPSGYNKVADLTIVIEWDETNHTFKVGAADTADTKYSGYTADTDKNTFKITVDNKSGAILPSTGGMGTTIFYVIGGLLVLAAAVLLISRRRVSEK